MNDYERGIVDCAKGLPPKKDASEKYLQGYVWQYELEQKASFRGFN